MVPSGNEGASKTSFSTSLLQLSGSGTCSCFEAGSVTSDEVLDRCESKTVFHQSYLNPWCVNLKLLCDVIDFYRSMNIHLAGGCLQKALSF